MTANENRTGKLKAISILPTRGNNVPDIHRPFSCSWYRIVFKPVSRLNDSPLIHRRTPSRDKFHRRTIKLLMHAGDYLVCKGIRSGLSFALLQIDQQLAKLGTLGLQRFKVRFQRRYLL